MCFSCHDAYSCSIFCSSTHYIKGEFIQQGLFLKKKRTKGLADWKNIL
ncbi:hypothetical protein BPJM79_30340 [Bacillus pumilus]